MIRVGIAVIALFGAEFCSGIELSTGKAMNEALCSITSPAAVFLSEDREIFVRVIPRSYRATDRITLQWLDPMGAVEQQNMYVDLPASRQVCLVSRLSVAGLSPATKPGVWTVRVLLNGGPAGERPFRIAASAGSHGVEITSAIPHEVDSECTRLDLEGSGFSLDSVVHFARFTEAGGWQYLAAELPRHQSATRLSVQACALEPGEYIVVLRAGDGSFSLPARFVIETRGGYQAPVPAGEHWVVTQGPYGSFSHWNRSLHAWDIAPKAGRYVVAMRSGIVHTHDLGLHQTPNQHSFGNYISIDHEDGEYSHYAHLATGLFLVRDGERVQQGQRLAVVGNSGYTLGNGGGYHVHVHVTRSPLISAQSVPFQFGAPRAAKATAPDPESVQVAQWWTRGLTVPNKTAGLSIHMRVEKASEGLNLHVTGPDGRSYGPYPDEVHFDHPLPGEWLISVQGMRGGAEPIGFRIESEIERQRPRTR